MAIKDLNNKRTGDKLYASEWNDVMNEILAHFKNKRIHEDIVVTTGDENLLIYKDTNDVEHQFVLYPKEGTTYGELFILSVNSSQLDEYNIYNINNVSAKENIIDFKISYSRAVNIDGKTDHYEKTGATITALELPQNFLVVETSADISIKVPENQEYTTKNYQFSIKVSMNPENEDAQNTKTFTVNLTQNAKDATYSNPKIGNVELQDSTALDNGKILSKGGELVYRVNYYQMYGETQITSGGQIKLESTDVNGNSLNYTWNDNDKLLTIAISKNNTDSDFTYSNFKIKVEMTQDGVDYTSDYHELTKYTQNKRRLSITIYSEISDITLIYPNNNIISQSGTSQNGITPSFSFKAKTVKTYDNDISETVTPKPQYTSIPQDSGITKQFTENSGSYQGTEVFDTTTGKIVKTSSNSNPYELNVAKVYLTLSINNVDKNSDTITVKQTGVPSAYYRFVNTNVTPNEYTNPVPLTSGEENTITITSENNNKDIIFHSTNEQFSNYQNYYSDGTNYYPVVLNPNSQFAAYYGLTHNYTDDDTTIGNITFYGCAAANVRTGDIIKVRII